MNMMDLNEISNMHSYVVNNISIADGNNSLTYDDICGIYCNDSNAIVLSFIQV